jgi:drug/metabolite transporter (DMT)-like permease
MPYLYLISTVFLQSALSVLSAFYNKKNAGKKDISQFYSFLLLTSVFSAWTVMFLIDGEVNIAVLPYALLFAVGFTAAMVMMVLALKSGPVVLTTLIMQLSLIVVTVWGFFFWGDSFTPLVGIGLILVAISLWLCLYTGKGKGKKISFKWLIFVSLMFLGNACCTIAQKTQQLHFDGKYGNFTMMIATGISALVSLLLYVRSDRRDSKLLIRTSWYYPVSAGVLNALVNLFIMLLATSDLSPSLIYPVISVGALAVTTIFSVFAFKEKMRPWQWIGVGVGAAAVAFLSV